MKQRRPVAWPVQPGEPIPTATDRARIIARGYRALALQYAPGVEVEQLDRTALAVGEPWITSHLDTGEDRITRAEFALIAGVKPVTIASWHSRGTRWGDPPTRGVDGRYSRAEVVEWLRLRDTTPGGAVVVAPAA